MCHHRTQRWMGQIPSSTNLSTSCSAPRAAHRLVFRPSSPSLCPEHRPRLTRSCGWLKKVLLHFREQCPQVAKSQKTPRQKWPGQRSLSLPRKTARFLVAPDHNKGGIFQSPSPPPQRALLNRVVVTGPRKVNGTRLSPRLPRQVPVCNSKRPGEGAGQMSLKERT